MSSTSSLSGQPNGFISNEIWHEWVVNVFLPYVNKLRQKMGKPNQMVLFLVDSHSTRKHEPTIKLFEQYNIMVLILPAHSSTILQPLDLTCNGELKRLLRLNFLPVGGEDRPTKRNRLLYTAVMCLQIALSGLFITCGFSRAGIYPFCAEAPLNSTLVRHPIEEVDFQPPQKKKRGPSIAGKVLTAGLLSAPQICPPAPIPSLPPAPLCKIVVPSCSPAQITLENVGNPSIADFVNM